MKIFLVNNKKNYEINEGRTVSEFIKENCPNFIKKGVVAKLGKELIDLNAGITKKGDLEILDSLNDEARIVLNHSAAHLTALAVKKIFPEVLLGIGPSKPYEFFYDFYKKKPFNQKDLELIEKEVQKIIDSNLPFKRIEVSKKEMNKILGTEKFKKELLQDFENNKVSYYLTGNNFADLCAGPHIKSSAVIKGFKLLTSSTAYWKGDETREVMQRIYGVTFFKKTELDVFLKNRQEAQQRDHRIIGKKLELFAFSEEIGPGLPLWLPKGNIIKEELENWAKEVEKEQGYLRVTTPTITKEGLYYTSGHLPYYADNNFPAMELDDGQKYYIKPMNCPHHHMIFKTKSRSYKELPLKLSEYGRCHRYEKHGELRGLFRVRSMDMNDAHIYCSKKQAVSEFKKVIELHKYYYTILGITDYQMELALRNPKDKKKYHGSDKIWKEAESLMREAMKGVGVKLVEDIGGAAFYGPKVDFQIKSSVGKIFSASTNQLDLFMPEKFNLEFINEKGVKEMPYVIHRAPLGTHERFIGFLIEHFNGNFPFWLSPVQVIIIPLSMDQKNYCTKIFEELKKNFRIEFDDSTNRFSNKIRKAQEQKIPYMLIIGKEEQKLKTITLRKRNGENVKGIKLNELKDLFEKKKETKDLRL